MWNWVQVTSIQGLLNSIAGPLADMVGAEHRSSVAVGAATMVNTSRVVLSEGQAIQNPDERGNMMLRRSSSSSSSSSSTSSTTPFRIIAVEGGVSPGMGEYPILLIFTCDIDANGDPQSELLLLSRTPTVAPQTVFLLLSGANLQGIFPDCDSPFVPSVQRPDNCAAASTA